MLSSDTELEDAGTYISDGPIPESPRSSTLSPCPSPVSLTSYSGKGSVGRPRRSAVWDYFTYDVSSNKSICQVGSSDSAAATSPGGSCGHEVTGKFTTNLKGHLKSCHSSCYLELLKQEERAKKKGKGKAERQSMGVKQKTLKEVYQAKYDKTSSRWQNITRKMATFVASSNVPNSIVENVEFQLMIQTLDPRYKIPGRSKISKEMDLLMADLRGKIKVCLDSAQRVSVCADIWTKCGMTSSYLGVTCHFFSKYDHRRHSVTLAVRLFPHPHIAERVRSLLDDIMKEWGIDQKLYVVITDNGKNMVKAFRNDALAATADTNEDEDNNEPEDIENSDDGDEGCVDEERDFDTKELQHDIAFAHVTKRLGCFAHSIQLVIQKFTNESPKPLMKKAQALVKKINKSSRATEILLSLCGKKLVSTVPTRWSSIFLMIDRLLDVKVPLNTTLEKLEWDNLAHSEWRTLESIHKLLKPFAQYTTLISGEDYTTLSTVIPILMELQLHLREMVQVPEISAVAHTLQSDLNRRFRKYTNPGDDSHEPIYIVSTILDPRYKPFINAVQLKAGRDQLLQMLKSNGEQSDSHSSGQSTPARSQEEEGPVRKRRRFSLLSRLIEDKLRQDKEKTAKQPIGQQELDRYISLMPSVDDNDDPLAFWVKQKESYPLLSALAVDIMCIPGSSAPVERIFSTAGEATSGKRNRLWHKNLEREVFI